MNIYVGNLSFSSNEDGLKQFFEQFGTVSMVKMMKDKITGKPRGFAFVEMPIADEAKLAIEKTNGAELDGRNLRVNEAHPVEGRVRRDFRGHRPQYGGGFNRNNRRF